MSPNNTEDDEVEVEEIIDADGTVHLVQVVEELVLEDEEDVEEAQDEKMGTDMVLSEEKKVSAVPPRPPMSSPLSTQSGTTTATSSTSQPRTPHDKRRRRRKRKISFKKTVGVHSIPNLDTYSTEERIRTWFQPDEYGQMEDECDITSEFMETRKPLMLGYCSRGLEAWTTEGEQRKEGHVQLAIDIVWQAQLEQWQASSDYKECWDFIRCRYLQISKACHKYAHKRGLSDEQDVQSYLVGVRAVEKNRRRMLGLKESTERGRIRRSASESTPSGRKKTAFGQGRTPPGRSHSAQSPSSKLKGLLKISIYPSDDEEEAKKQPVKKVANAKSSTSDNRTSKTHEPADDEVSRASTKASTNSRKIQFKAKSKSKVPVSPVASLCTDADSDENSLNRRMRSHMSVCSDDSTRRRMLRTAATKEL